MKRVDLILLIILLLLIGCARTNKRDVNELITVDVTKRYFSKKELILQDFMDVEYIVLETNNDFINQGFVWDVGKDIILVGNRNGDGAIFVYDKTGKALRKINRKGQGSEEYVNIFNITLDEEKGEMFVNDIYSKKIIVYDLFGKYKRSFSHKKGRGSLFYDDIINYDKDHLICYDKYNKDIAFVLISKQDGEIVKEIKIPFKKKKLLMQSKSVGKMVYSTDPGFYRKIISFNGSWILLELSSDTVYTFLPDYTLRPFMVRAPSIQSMSPEEMLIFRLVSDRYIFMETIKNIYDWDTDKGFPKTFFMYDIQEKSFSGYAVYNGDYLIKKELYMNVLRPGNQGDELWYPLEAYQLVESYRKGELKGKLKEIAAELNEESNPVIMLIKSKK